MSEFVKARGSFIPNYKYLFLTKVFVVIIYEEFNTLKLSLSAYSSCEGV